MGGSETPAWLAGLDASFEAAIAREEEVAARDLAFSLRQDVDVRGAVARSGTGWLFLGPDAAASRVDDVGLDYVRAGGTLVPAGRAVLRSAPGDPPALRDGTLVEVLGAACRAGSLVTVAHVTGAASGRLDRVTRDHLAVRNGAVEVIVGRDAIVAVRIERETGYSASRGFSG